MTRALALALLVLLAAPAVAGAHARLETTSPERGAQMQTAPKQVVFGFDEPVEASFGAVRVFDAAGRRVEAGGAFHPGGIGKDVAARLKPGLGDGTYTATYRLVSADGHPVSGGFVFLVGEGGAAPTKTVGDLVQQAGAGPVTDAAFGVARVIAYGALAVALGGVLFLLLVWRGEPTVFRARLRLVVLGAAVAGALASVAQVVLQAATGAGTSFWSALDPDTLSAVLDTRFGRVWAIAAAAWLLVAILAALRRPALALVPLAFLILAPGLSGHAATQSPTWLLIPANAVHVAAMATWVGGLAILLLVVPAVTRRLEPPERTRTLATVLRAFSPVALAAVATLIVTGTIQAIVEVGSFPALVETPYGRAVLIKIALLAGLIAIGAWHRRRSIPALTAAAEQGETPGRSGVALRRALRGEIALLVGVLAATAALAAYAPSVAETAGPFSSTSRLGPAQLDLTVDPARPGPNEIHLYLTDPRSGRPYTAAKEVDVTAELPEHDIGKLDQVARRAGPGHYVVPGATLGVAGDWRLEVAARVSDFDEYRDTVEVPVS